MQEEVWLSEDRYKTNPLFSKSIKGGQLLDQRDLILRTQRVGKLCFISRRILLFHCKRYHFYSLTTEGKTERQFSPQSIFESSYLSKRKISSDLCKKESMKIWKKIFRKVEVLVLTKKLINWRDFSEIYDTIAVEQLPPDFCLLWALHQEIISLLHPHMLFFCFIPPHRPPSDPQSGCFIIMLYLFFTECCVSDTGTEKAPDKCVLNEWMSPNPFVNNFFRKHLTFREAQVPVGHSTYRSKLSPSVQALHKVLPMLAPKTKWKVRCYERVLTIRRVEIKFLEHMVFANLNLLDEQFQWGKNTLQNITVREGKTYSIALLIIPGK